MTIHHGVSVIARPSIRGARMASSAAAASGSHRPTAPSGRWRDVRKSRPDDLPAVSALFSESFPRFLTTSYSADVLERALPMLTTAKPELLSCGTYYVAVAEGQHGERIVGAGGWTPDRPGSGELQDGRGHIRHFATSPDYARQGIAKSLMSACCQEARENGVTVMECFSTLSAVPFYESVGFVQLSPEDVDFGDGVKFPAMLMELRLTD